MADREILLRMLKRAARPPKRKRAIVCYDSAWAGLPRVTVLDPPKRKASRRKRQPVLTTKRAYQRAVTAEQLVLL